MDGKEPVTVLRGVGPGRAGSLERMKIRTVEDLLFCFPRDYEDRREVLPIAALPDGAPAQAEGEVLRVTPGPFRSGKRRTLRVIVRDASGTMEVLFFQAGYLANALKIGQRYRFYGRAQHERDRIRMLHPAFEPADADAQPGIRPVYPLRSGLSQKELRKWVREALPAADTLADPLPGTLRRANRLCGLAYALRGVHFPDSRQQLQEARFRLAFEELFLLQLGLLFLRAGLARPDRGIAFDPAVRIRAFTETLPFSLTGAQDRVLAEIERDMERSAPMARLVQGDVGSGKTAVAAAAAYKAIKCGWQAAMMAPTELLALQHFRTLRAYFEPLGIDVRLVTGTMPAKEKAGALEAVASGTAGFVVGTHALLRPEVRFHRLGLVVTDEQHRFGVEQRNVLSEKGELPDLLVMTATPIPRTLAVVLYGDLDLSVIDELPPGRTPVRTKVAGTKGRDAVYRFIGEEVARGRQAFVVAPLIEGSELLDARSATEVYRDVCDRLPGVRTALLHGDLRPAEKEAIMAGFVEGTVDVLVSTVVIEVGIDVPNATVMAIESAERFGLATLHQLRGRVGRGKDAATCILISDAPTALAKQRLAVMESTADGFRIAEKDLELRGPGELFGVRQHGLPEFRVADLARHGQLLEEARRSAQEILAADPSLTDAANLPLRERVLSLFGAWGNLPL